MKTFILFFTILSGTLIAGFLFGCKKDSQTKKQTCKIIALVSGTNAISFTYDDTGREITKNGAATDKLIYNGNTITITSTAGTTLNTTTSVTVNDKGLATLIGVKDGNGETLSNTLNEYSGTELHKSTVTGSTPGDTVITTYTWSDGNLVSSLSQSNVVNYHYSSSILSQDGDFWNTTNLQQGYQVFKTKNALTSVGSGGNVINYLFDATGKIATIQNIAGGSVFAIDYEYECH